jgi:hypothetical protein
VGCSLGYFIVESNVESAISKAKLDKLQTSEGVL